jgi:hypothetical protein
MMPARIASGSVGRASATTAKADQTAGYWGGLVWVRFCAFASAQPANLSRPISRLPITLDKPVRRVLKTRNATIRRVRSPGGTVILGVAVPVQQSSGGETVIHAVAVPVQTQPTDQDRTCLRVARCDRKR